jgi:hypothetical protein
MLPKTLKLLHVAASSRTNRPLGTRVFRASWLVRIDLLDIEGVPENEVTLPDRVRFGEPCGIR